MNLFAEFHELIASILRRIAAQGRLPADLDLQRFVVEPPRDSAHGDLSTNAAMVYAREARSVFANPRQLAVEIAAALTDDPDVAEAEVAGPGFINIRLKLVVFARVLRAALEQGVRFGRPALACAKTLKINVEYVSANPTGPMHVGHARGAAFGDALANLLSFAGRRVTREYYVHDAGAQVDVLARSVFLRYREALGERIEAIPEGLYPGDYLIPVGEALAREFGPILHNLPEVDWLPQVRARAIAAMMAMIREDLRALNIDHEVFSSERALTGADGGQDRVREAIEVLRKKDLVYQGRLPPPKGAPSE